MLTADQTLGFLPPGTQVQLTATATDDRGNQFVCPAPTYFFVHPVGGAINVIQGIDQATGVMTIGNAQGAARIWAECEGVQSNLRLVSGTG